VIELEVHVGKTAKEKSAFKVTATTSETKINANDIIIFLLLRLFSIIVSFN